MGHLGGEMTVISTTVEVDYLLQGTEAEIHSSTSYKFCLWTDRIYLPRFIDVSSVASQQQSYENVDPTRTDIGPVLQVILAEMTKNAQC